MKCNQWILTSNERVLVSMNFVAIKRMKMGGSKREDNDNDKMMRRHGKRTKREREFDAIPFNYRKLLLKQLFYFQVSLGFFISSFSLSPSPPSLIRFFSYQKTIQIQRQKWAHWEYKENKKCGSELPVKRLRKIKREFENKRGREREGGGEKWIRKPKHYKQIGRILNERIVRERGEKKWRNKEKSKQKKQKQN